MTCADGDGLGLYAAGLELLSDASRSPPADERPLEADASGALEYEHDEGAAWELSFYALACSSVWVGRVGNTLPALTKPSPSLVHPVQDLNIWTSSAS